MTVAESSNRHVLPDEQELSAIGDLEVLDESAKPVAFKSLYSDGSSRHLIIFLRHYFCGVSVAEIESSN